MSCKIGYVGPLCSNCEAAKDIVYTKISSGECMPCLALAPYIITFLIFSILLGIFMWALVESNNKEALRTLQKGVDEVRALERRKTIIFFRIVVNYFHMISIISDIDFRWPIEIKSFLKIQSSFGTAGIEVLSLECLFSRKITISYKFINISSIYQIMI